MVINVGLLGPGVVGGGVARTLRERPRRSPGASGGGWRCAACWSRDSGRAAADVERRAHDHDRPGRRAGRSRAIQIVVEMMGGEEPAHDYIRRAIANGKHVVTANKEVMAKHGPSIVAAAAQPGPRRRLRGERRRRHPGDRAVQAGPAGERHHAGSTAIINGTTNYIITRMSTAGLDFATALARGAGGRATPSPTPRTTSRASTRRTSWRSSPRSRSTPGSTPTRSTARASPASQPSDFRYARELGYAIKLLAIGKTGRRRPRSAGPPDAGPGRDDAGERGRRLQRGPGRGRPGRAHPLLRPRRRRRPDRQRRGRRRHRPGAAAGRRRDPAGRSPSTTSRIKVRPMDDVQSRYYLRLVAADRPGVIAADRRHLRRPRRSA